MILAAFLAAAVPSAPALDFTLSTKTVQEDGYAREVSYFSWDAKTTVAIQPPPKWKILATPATMTMVSPNFPGSEVRIEKSPFEPGMQFKEPELGRYREQALAQAPAGSTEVRLTDEKADPLPIFDWTDREYVLEYALYALNYKRSVLYLNVDAATQLRVTAVGPLADFDRVHKAAHALLHTWQPAAVAPAGR